MRLHWRTWSEFMVLEGERLPLTRESAQRLGLVTLAQMLNALVWAVEHPPMAVQVLDVPRIRALQAK